MEAFVVRLHEPVEQPADSAVRGIVRHVATGEEAAFTSGPELVAFLKAHTAASRPDTRRAKPGADQPEDCL